MADQSTENLLLKSVCDTGFFTPTYKYKGVYYSWASPPELLQALETFEVRNDDLYIFTYPKSGTHWIIEIANLIINKGDERKIDRRHLSTFLDTYFCSHPDEIKTTVPGYKQMCSWESPRLMVGHVAEHLAPHGIWENKGKVIYFARNPKDVATSYFHFAKDFLPHELQTFEAFLEHFFSDKTIFGSWFDHVLDFWKHKDDANILFLKYEDCHKNLPEVVLRVAKFLEKEISEEECNQIVQKSTLHWMKKTYRRIEEENQEVGKSLTHFFGSVPYLRKGQVGTWKSVFTESLNEKFDKIYAAKMTGTGLEFDFEI